MIYLGYILALIGIIVGLYKYSKRTRKFQFYWDKTDRTTGDNKFRLSDNIEIIITDITPIDGLQYSIDIRMNCEGQYFCSFSLNYQFEDNFGLSSESSEYQTWGDITFYIEGIRNDKKDAIMKLVTKPCHHPLVEKILLKLEE